jgi:hypothetical protein
LGAAFGNDAVDPLKVGERCGALASCRSRAKPLRRGRCRDWTGGAYGSSGLGRRDSPDHERPQGRRRKPKWYESWGRGFESRRGHHLVVIVSSGRQRPRQGILRPKMQFPGLDRCILTRRDGARASAITDQSCPSSAGFSAPGVFFNTRSVAVLASGAATAQRFDSLFFPFPNSQSRSFSA